MISSIPRVWLVVGAILLASIVALGLQSWRLGKAKDDIAQQKNMITAQSQTIDNMSQQLSAKNAALITLGILADDNNRAQAKLRQQMADTGALLSTRENMIARLYRENAALKKWAGDRLPDDVIRLHQRPAITGGAAYRAWLSETERLPAASQ